MINWILRDFKKKLSQMEHERVLQNNELKPEMLFDTERFDLSKFNTAYDTIYGNSTELIPHTGNPSALNDTSCHYSNFGENRCMLMTQKQIYHLMLMEQQDN